MFDLYVYNYITTLAECNTFVDFAKKKQIMIAHCNFDNNTKSVSNLAYLIHFITFLGVFYCVLRYLIYDKCIIAVC